MVTALTWAPSLSQGYVYEDGRYAGDAIEGRIAWAVPKRLTTSVSWALDRAAFGIQPVAFHAGNVIWHLAAVLLLLTVLWSSVTPWAAVLGAGVFALHPIQVEAVDYVSSRPELVAAVGVLLAVWAASAGRLAGVVVGVVLAVLAKETAIVAWGLVCLWAVWTSPAAFPWRRFLILTAAGVAGSAALVLGLLRGWTLVADPTLAGATFAALGRLLALLVWPEGQTIDHDWAAIAWAGPLALSVGAGLTGWALTRGYWDRSWFAFAWLWTLIVISPRLVMPLAEGLHEHHMNFVLIGWCLSAGHWATATARQRRESIYG